MGKNTLSEDVIKLMASENYAPMTEREIAGALGLNRKKTAALRKALAEMLKKGSIAKVRGDRYGACADLELVVGILEFRQSGRALLRAEDGAAIAEVKPEDASVALNGDKVLARMQSRSQAPRAKPRRRAAAQNIREKKYAKVVRILERRSQTVAGTLKRSHNFWHIVPDDPRFFYDVIVADPAKSGVSPAPAEGDKVLVLLDEWTRRHMNPTGRIVENFGASHTPMAEYKAILSKYKLSETFPATAANEAAQTPQSVSESDIKGRLDMRRAFTITIDPEDARDFDDALSLQRTSGGWVVGVHIADVSHYVRQNSAIDREALKRGNSTYLTGTVIPMLPFELSNGICSLVENEDRLVKSVFLTYDASGACTGASFANCVIRSNKRLSYEQAYAMLTLDDPAKIRAVKPPEKYETAYAGKSLGDMPDKQIMRLRGAVRRLWSIASALRKKRMREGALDLEMPEFKIFCDAEGYADRVEKIVSDESHQLVEEFMLAANEAVARELFGRHIPYISRVHDAPSDEKLLELRDELELFGIHCGDLTRRRELIKVLAEISKHPQSYILKTKFLRSLMRAEYRASADGHFGLAKQYYAHFTSPIRRYADLTAHRCMNFLMKSLKMPYAPASAETPPVKAALEKTAEHISATEQNSAEAERESNKIKLIEFFKRSEGSGSAFEAVITSLSNHGFFVELTESMASGFVHMHSLGGDIYRLNDSATELRGRRTGATYRIGDKIFVQVERVDEYKRQIDFSPSSKREALTSSAAENK